MKTMKRYLISLIILLWVCAGQMRAKDGLPFFVNYSPAMYHAHNRNFDIVSDDYGRVYVANFEGVLYYDQTEWHTLHAPGIFRVTKLFKDSKGRIWVGGYNLFGYLTSGENGALELQLIFSKNNKGFLGEVTGIEEVNGKICVTSSLGDADIQDDSMDDFILRRAANAPEGHYQGVPVNKRIDLPDGSTLLATAGAGFVVLDKTGEERYTLTEQNGLCNNNVNGLYMDASGYVWGATDNGIFVVNVQTAYTYFRSTEGLSGEVQSICQTDHGLYVGTLRGLFYREADTFEPVKPIQQACWQLQQDEAGNIYASTAGGLYCIQGKQVRQITDSHTLSTYICGNGEYYTGEVDGVYRIQDGERRQMNIVEKATFFYKDDRQTLWIRNIFGQVFRCEGDYSQYQILVPQNAQGEKDGFNNTLFFQDGHIYVLSHVGLFKWNDEQQRLEEQTESTSFWTSSHQYPRFIYPEAERIWGTNNEGKELYVYSGNSEDTHELNTLLRPVHDLTIGTIEVEGKDVWLGGNFGLIHWDASMKEPDYPAPPRVFIRRLTINNNSLIWGGFGQGDQLAAGLPFKGATFESGIQEIKLNFSADKFSTLGAVEYRYRMDHNGRWSDWSTETSARFANPRSGHYAFQVMARDRYGRVTEAVSLPIHIRYPFYLRWYSLTAYVLVLALGIQQLIRWRMKRLIHEKMRLENIVEERTSQLRRQKNEIEEKSKRLETALDDLSKAQYQLIRQEKMATVGTLTKGLVDRILNPMNYVNNFSHMSIGLVKDLKENLNDDQANMTPDVYEDSIDALEMLNTNLQKIEEHGLNTTRILKAMEEMLKERGGNMAVIDIAAICCKNIEMLHSYYADDIARYRVKVEAPDKDLLVAAEVNAEQFSKTIMSMLANSMYAIRKKAQQGKDFQPLIRLNLSADVQANKVEIRVYDNGIGIEASILDKVFDPFFTTKTTAEAVGVGMYLSREIILNHGGNVSVQSTKDEYTEFVIVLPIHHDGKGGTAHEAEASAQPAM